VSRAFVKEQDNPPPEPLPELKIGDEPNLVTERGLRLIGEKIAALEDEAAAKPDDATAARIARDLRYWEARKASAQLTDYDARTKEVGFGSRVTFRRNGGAAETLEIVGEDESDPASGRISWTAPVARALHGVREGETMEMEGRKPVMELTVVSVEKI
jgi:transcription elongation GreA/GreB family factor